VNNRDTATLIWLAIALAASLLKHDIRHSLWEVVKAFITPKVIGPVLALAAWTLGLSALGHTLGLWERDARSDAVVWFITVGWRSSSRSIACRRAGSSAGPHARRLP
jgi:hypothetical protein